MNATAKIKKYCILSGRCLLPSIVYYGKNTSSQPNYIEKVYFGASEKLVKDSTIKSNPSFKKIMQKTKLEINYRTVERILRK